MVSKFQTIGSKTHSGTFSVQATEGRVSRPRGVALQAAGLERDNGRLGAKAAGLERATLQAGGFARNQPLSRSRPAAWSPMPRGLGTSGLGAPAFPYCFLRTPSIRPPTLCCYNLFGTLASEDEVYVPKWPRLGVTSRVCTRNSIMTEIRHNRDSWDSPLDARIRGLPLVTRHCPMRMGNPCMRGLLLHSPRHEQQLAAPPAAPRDAPRRSSCFCRG